MFVIYIFFIYELVENIKIAQKLTKDIKQLYLLVINNEKWWYGSFICLYHNCHDFTDITIAFVLQLFFFQPKIAITVGAQCPPLIQFWGIKTVKSWQNWGSRGPKPVGSSLGTGRDCRWGEWMSSALSYLNTTPEVPLSKAPDPQLLPGHCSLN